MPEQIVVLTEGGTNPHTAKTASAVIRYRGDEVVAVLDSQQAGKTSGDLLGVGGDLPIVHSIKDVPAATTLLLGTAPPGGRIPDQWRPIILDAMARGLNVIGGLHDFLSDDTEFVDAAERYGVTLTDIRKTDENDIARRIGLRPDCLRVLTVGHDCAVGKKIAAIELSKAIQQRGLTAKFIATGQTGIMIEGNGCAIDHVVSDFVSGAVEKMILTHQDHDVLVIEGQGSLVHPSYSAVTLGLLHGALPQAMILCYQMGRTTITGLDHLKIPPLARIKELNETMASIFQPGKVIGIAMNSYGFDDDEVAVERQRIREEFGLPVCDLIRHGAAELTDAILEFRSGSEWQTMTGGVQ